MYLFKIHECICIAIAHFTMNSSNRTIFVRSVGHAEVLLLVSKTKLAVSFSKAYINAFSKSALQL